MYETLALLAVFVLVYSAVAGADMGVLKKTSGLPARLLLIGLPLTITLGFGIAALLVDSLSLFAIAVLATMLAPRPMRPWARRSSPMRPFPTKSARV